MTVEIEGEGKRRRSSPTGSRAHPLRLSRPAATAQMQKRRTLIARNTTSRAKATHAHEAGWAGPGNTQAGRKGPGGTLQPQ